MVHDNKGTCTQWQWTFFVPYCLYIISFYFCSFCPTTSSPPPPTPTLTIASSPGQFPNVTKKKQKTTGLKGTRLVTLILTNSYNKSYTLCETLRVIHLSTQPVEAARTSLMLSVTIPASLISEPISVDFPLSSVWAVTDTFLMLACLPMRARTYI